jgi:hypothetical protein
VSSGKVWMPGIELGLGLWQESFEGIERLWLRWYNSGGNWIPTPLELLEQEKMRSDELAAKLRELGINPDNL